MEYRLESLESFRFQPDTFYQSIGKRLERDLECQESLQNNYIPENLLNLWQLLPISENLDSYSVQTLKKNIIVIIIYIIIVMFIY